MQVTQLFWKTEVLLGGIQTYYGEAWLEFPSLMIDIHIGGHVSFEKLTQKTLIDIAIGGHFKKSRL